MIIHTDASEVINKNTGNSICAVHSVVVYDDNYRFIKKETSKSFSKSITQAEGTSILMAIEIAENGSTIKSDSQGIVEGRCSESELINLLCKEKDITLEWISREENTHADLVCHQERNKVINSYIKAGYTNVNKPKNTQKVAQLENILKVGQAVKQKMSSDVEKFIQPVGFNVVNQVEVNVVKQLNTGKVSEIKKVSVANVINQSIFTLIECSDNNESTVAKTKKRNDMVTLFEKTHKKVLKKVENNKPLSPQDVQCLEGLEYLGLNKKDKVAVIKEICYPKYIERSRGKKVIKLCDFVGLAKKHMKYVVGTQKSFNTLVDSVLHEIANG